MFCCCFLTSCAPPGQHALSQESHSADDGSSSGAVISHSEEKRETKYIFTPALFFFPTSQVSYISTQHSARYHSHFKIKKCFRLSSSLDCAWSRHQRLKRSHGLLSTLFAIVCPNPLFQGTLAIHAKQFLVIATSRVLTTDLAPHRSLVQQATLPHRHAYTPRLFMRSTAQRVGGQRKQSSEQSSSLFLAPVSKLHGSPCF